MAYSLLAVCAYLFAVAVLLYVFVAGWDLGVGILHPLIARPADRDALLDSIAPFWDARRMGLACAGVTVLLGFSLAYSTLPPHLYSPIIVMATGLLLRATSFAFREFGGRLRWIWQMSFAAGSLGAACAHGWILSVLLEGVDAPAHLPAWLVVIRLLFPFVCGTAVVCVYGLLGACWLIFKTQGAVQTTAREVCASALVSSLLMLLHLSGLTLVLNPAVGMFWGYTVTLIGLAVLGVCTAIVAWQLHQSLWGPSDARPLQWATALLVFAFCAVLAGLYPNIASYRNEIAANSNDPTSLHLAWFGIAAALPVILLYGGLGYRVFRGKMLQSAACRASNHYSIASRRTSGAESSLHMS